MDPTSMRQHASMFMNYPRSSDVSGNQTMVVDGTSAGTDGINMNVVDFQLGDLTDSTAVLAPQQQQQNHLPTINKGRREKNKSRRTMSEKNCPVMSQGCA